MKCTQVKNLLSSYQDGELKAAMVQDVKRHLDTCTHCLQEHQQMSRAWEMLEVMPTITPSGDYMSRFWSKAAATPEPGYERLISHIKSILGNRRLIPVLGTLCLMIMIGSTGIVEQINTQKDLSQIKGQDVEMLENMDLAQNFDTIKDLDVIRNLNSAPKANSAQV